MVWVKSEYAGELAVVSAWISAVLPWYVSYAPEIEGTDGSALFLRFPFLQIRYIFGIPFADATDIRTPTGLLFRQADTIETGAAEAAYPVWYVAAAIVGLAVLLSFAMYVDLDRVEEALPIHPVRVMGGLLTGASVILAASAVLFYVHSAFGEYPVPIGVVVMFLLGVSLLRVELLGDGADGDGADDRDGAAVG